MAQRYYFFNSTTGDRRKYQAQHLAEYFGSVLSSGLIHINDEPELLVSVEAGTLNTVVDAGKAIIKGHLYENTTPLTLEHSIPEADLDRIDRIVLRLDLRNSERNILLHVKEGSPSSNPEPPELQRDNFIHELSLAQIRVRANTSSLDVDDLQDERLIDELCGLVQSMISLPTTRFQEQWDAFMDSVKDEGYATLQMLDDVDERLSREIDDIIEDYVRSPGYASASHSNNIYNVSLNPAPVEYKEGMGVVLKATNNTSGQPKINVNGLGVKDIYQSNGLEVPAFKENTVYTLRYNGSNFILQGEGGSDDNEVKALARLGLGLDSTNREKVTHMNDLYYYTSTFDRVDDLDNFRVQKRLRTNGTVISSVKLSDHTSSTSLNVDDVSYVEGWIIRSQSGNRFVYDENGTLLFETSISSSSTKLIYFDGINYVGYQTGSDSTRRLYKYDENGTLIETTMVRTGLSTRGFINVSSLKRSDGRVLISYVFGRASSNHFILDYLYNDVPFPSEIPFDHNNIPSVPSDTIGLFNMLNLYE